MAAGTEDIAEFTVSLNFVLFNSGQFLAVRREKELNHRSELFPAENPTVYTIPHDQSYFFLPLISPGAILS